MKARRQVMSGALDGIQMEKKVLLTAKELLGNAWVWLGAFMFSFAAVLAHSCSPDSPTITKDINYQYYYSHYTSGFATNSTVRFIKLYKRRKWLPDKKLADLNMYVRAYSSPEVVDLAYNQSRLTLYVEKQLMVDTLLDENICLEINYNEW
jgi:hypothetical protein